MSETASAPASSTARAIDTISVTFGESLTIIGLEVRRRIWATTSAAEVQEVPNAAPPSLTFGQEMLTSSRSIPLLSSRSAIAQYSSTVLPATFAMTTTSRLFRWGSSFCRNASTPGFCSPTELSIPDGVSAIRQGGLPCRSCRVVPLTEMPPSRSIG